MSAKKHPVPRAISYAALLPFLAMRARDCGYALAVHGSMATDLDVVAVPWTEDAGTAEELVAELLEWTDLELRETDTLNGVAGVKPHGRRVWTLHWRDAGCGLYVDLSVMPRSADR